MTVQGARSGSVLDDHKVETGCVELALTGVIGEAGGHKGPSTQPAIKRVRTEKALARSPCALVPMTLIGVLVPVTDISITGLSLGLVFAVSISVGFSSAILNTSRVHCDMSGTIGFRADLYVAHVFIKSISSYCNGLKFSLNHGQSFDSFRAGGITGNYKSRRKPTHSYDVIMTRQFGPRIGSGD